MDAAAATETSPKKTSIKDQLNVPKSLSSNGVTELDASQKSRLTLTTSTSNGSGGSDGHHYPKKKFMMDNDDLYYEGNRVYKDDLDSDKGSSVTGSVGKQKHNKIVKMNEYESGLKIERMPNNVRVFRLNFKPNSRLNFLI
jgi:hypothetical protein